MPRQDGTGPMGRGSMTGRGLGLCNGMNAAKFGAGFGLGLLSRCRRSFGRGFGGNFLGRGFGQGFAGNYNVDQAPSNAPKELLQEQKEILQSQLEAIDKQLKNL